MKINNLQCGFLDEAKAKKNPNFILTILLFVGVFVVGLIGSVTVMLPFTIALGIFSASSDISGNAFNVNAWTMIITLFSTVATTLISIFTVKIILKRKATSMGFIKKG